MVTSASLVDAEPKPALARGGPRRGRELSRPLAVLCAVAALAVVVPAAWASSSLYFTAAGARSMTAARNGAVPASLPDGRVLIAGGYNPNDGYLSRAEVFAPSTGARYRNATVALTPR